MFNPHFSGGATV